MDLESHRAFDRSILPQEFVKLRIKLVFLLDPCHEYLNAKKSLIAPACPPSAPLQRCQMRLLVAKVGSCLHKGDSLLLIASAGLVTGMS